MAQYGDPQALQQYYAEEARAQEAARQAAEQAARQAADQAARQAAQEAAQRAAQEAVRYQQEAQRMQTYQNNKSGW